MNYDAMKEFSDKLTSEMKNSQMDEESQNENHAVKTECEETPEAAMAIPSSDSDECEREAGMQEHTASLLDQQQELLKKLQGEMTAQTTRLASIELQLNRLSFAENHTGNDAMVQNLIAEVKGLKDAAQKQEKANTDILRESKNFQAGVKARMQDELDQYHKLQAQNVYAPILTEIAGLYISTEHLLESAEESHLKEQLKNALLDSLAELLEDNGVTIMRTEIGQARSLRLCKTRKTIATGDENLKGKVAKSYNPAFVLGNQILQKEIVDTYVFDPSLASKDENTAISDQTDAAANDDSAIADAALPEGDAGVDEISEETADRT